MRYILFDYWPGIWIYLGIWIVVAIVTLRYLLARSDCYTCSRLSGFRRSALLAAIVTPSIMTEGFIVALPAPALMGFLFMLPAVISPSHWVILPGILLLYVLPWSICTLLIFTIWSIMRRKKTEQSGPDNPRPCGTSGTSDARASAPPEASGDR
jgi:hypothetical protein